MKIAIIGTGYVGLVSGTCFAELGFEVTCIDVNTAKIEGLNAGIIPIYEPGLEVLVKKNIAANRLFFTSHKESGIKGADVIFIAVGTPPHPKTGEADLKYIYSAADDIAQYIDGYSVVVTKSTVPVDTNKNLQQHIQQKNPAALFDVVSNPEFLREGSAIEDFMKPDRIVIGTHSDKARRLMARLYAPLIQQNIPFICTSPVSAELIKYASNCFLATKITFINELADLCEKTNADIKDVAHAVGLDSRIGKQFLNAGPGYGGSCFPKDTQALAKTATSYGSPLTIVNTVIAANDARKRQMGQRILNLLQPHKAGKVGILGVSFKADTDDIRDSPALDIMPIIQHAGFEVACYDPEGMENGAKELPGVQWETTPYAAAQDAIALVIITEWNEFKSLDLKRLKTALKHPLLIDLRNLYNWQDLEDADISYIPLGNATKKMDTIA